MAKKVLKFYSKTCAPCKFMAPIIDQVVEETGADLISVDIEEDLDPEYELVNQYGVMKVPTIIILNETGGRDGEFLGITPKDVILEAIKK